MTPDRARQIDQLEFEAEAEALRQRALALVGTTMKAPVKGWERTPSTLRPRVTLNPYSGPAAKLQAVLREEAASRPGRRAKLHPFDGRLLTLAEISAMTGIPVTLLWSRICRTGMSAEDAVAGGKTPTRGFNSMGARAQQRLARPR